MNKPIVYLDMDGVLADLDGGMLDMFGHNTRDLDPATLFSRYLPDYVENQGFANENVLINAKMLVLALHNYKKLGLINLAICTSTGMFYRPISEVRDQKGKFIEKHFKELIDVPFCTTTSGREKCFLAHPKAFLIDDHYKNVDKFIEAGGGSFTYDAQSNTCVLDTMHEIDKFFGIERVDVL